MFLTNCYDRCFDVEEKIKNIMVKNIDKLNFCLSKKKRNCDSSNEFYSENIARQLSK